MNLRYNTIGYLLLFLLLGSGIARANNIPVSSGAWETGSNWSLGTAPIATDIVVIPAGFTMTVKVSGDICKSLAIAGSGTVVINSGATLSIGGHLSNAGTLTASAGSTITFNGTTNTMITGSGSYFIAGTVELNMGSPSTILDVQDPAFITGINAGGNYYISFLKGIWKMNNTATLNDCYNRGSVNALTIPFGVSIESDAGTMNLCRNAPTGNASLSGNLFINGGIVNVQTGQGFNSGQDFQYLVNGGTPQLYISAGTLNVGAGFNARTTGDFIDFHMTGGTMILALNGYSNAVTFLLADVMGGKTFMSGGTVILKDATNANLPDLDMGGANVAATLYSVTGGTVQLGYVNTQAGSSYFGVNAEPATNYPNISFQAGVPKNVSAFMGGNINMLSLFVNSNMTFDATGFSNVNILSNNGTFAFDNEGNFIPATNTVGFSGTVPQLIISNSLTTQTFYNLSVSNTAGNVILGVPTSVSNQLRFTSGLLDASNYSLTLSAGNIPVSGASSSAYIITGNGSTSTGQLNINNISVNSNTLFPIGTSSFYLPATINPGTNTGNGYSAFVFQGATTNALSNGAAFSAGTLSKMLNAVWNISRTAGTGTATLNLDWASSGTALEGSAFQGYGLNIGISQYTASTWQTGTGGGNEATQSASASFSSFTPFTVVGASTVLAVSLTDFDAHLQSDNTVLLSWEETDAILVHDFTVQKSVDGLGWNTIGDVAANKNQTNASRFSYVDLSPEKGENYYRLIIHYVDDISRYSPVKQVSVNSMSVVYIFPNPANNVLNVSMRNSRAPVNIRLLSVSGKILECFAAGSENNSVLSMNVSKYPSGIYLLEISDDRNVLTSSIVIVAH
jgi:hypothetical protein